MKKEIILALSCLLPFPVLADCNVGAMTLTGASNSGQWSSLVTLTGQKLTSYTQANNSLESQAVTNSPTNLPASNIIAFEYRSVTPINLIGNEQVEDGFFIAQIQMGQLLVEHYLLQYQIVLVLN